MTPKERAAMQQALEAMIAGNDEWPRLDVTEAIIALREALDHFRDATKKVVEQEREPITEPVVPWLSHKVAEQAEQEPVAWMEDSIEFYASDRPSSTFTIPLYTNPVRTKDLTDDEIRAMFNGYVAPEILLMFRAVIAADREKNK